MPNDERKKLLPETWIIQVLSLLLAHTILRVKSNVLKKLCSNELISIYYVRSYDTAYCTSKFNVNIISNFSKHTIHRDLKKKCKSK